MGKKRIAIITIYTIPNYGSILQAYALQKYLEKTNEYGKIEIINYDYRGFTHRLKRIRVTGFIAFIKNEISNLIRKDPEVRKRKLKRFENFRRLYIKESCHYPNKWSLRLSRALKDYDVYITGSDQVWNSKEVQGNTVFLLDFVPQGKKKLSFSSSFGIDYIDEKYKSRFRRLLQNYNAISVREKEGLILLKELGVNNHCYLTCDPSLLLDSEDYNQIASQSSLQIEEPYILVYGLSYAFNPMPAILEVIKAAVDKYRCKVIFLSQGRIPYTGDSQYVLDAGPNEFIKYVANAKYIVTSSFHGTAFSLIYRKPFTPIAPKHGDTRIIDLLETLGISDIIQEPGDTNVVLTEEEIYTAAFEVNLEDYINASRKYLSENLK